LPLASANGSKISINQGFSQNVGLAKALLYVYLLNRQLKQTAMKKP